MTFDLGQLDLPVVQAPMAGGPSTPELAAAVCEVGGLGFLAAGYKSAEAVAADIQAVRERTDRPFGVNIFVPSDDETPPSPISAYAQSLEGEAERYGVDLGEPRLDDDDFDAKLELVLREG